MTEEFICGIDWIVYFAYAIILLFAMKYVDTKFAVPPPPPMPAKLPSADVFDLGYGEWVERRITNYARGWPIYLGFVLFLLFKYMFDPALLSGVYLLGAFACAVVSLCLYTFFRWCRHRTGAYEQNVQQVEFDRESGKWICPRCQHTNDVIRYSCLWCDFERD